MNRRHAEIDIPSTRLRLTPMGRVAPPTLAPVHAHVALRNSRLAAPHMVTIDTGLRRVSVPFPVREVASIAALGGHKPVQVTSVDGEVETYPSVPDMLLRVLYDEDYVVDLDYSRDYHDPKKEARLPPETLAALAELTAGIVAEDYVKTWSGDDGPELEKSLRGQWYHYHHGLPIENDRELFGRFVGVVRDRLAPGMPQRRAAAEMRAREREALREIARRNEALVLAARPTVEAAQAMADAPGFNLSLLRSGEWPIIEPKASMLPHIPGAPPIATDWMRLARRAVSRSGIAYEVVHAAERVGPEYHRSYLLLAQIPGQKPTVLVHLPDEDTELITLVARAFDAQHAGRPRGVIAPPPAPAPAPARRPSDPRQAAFAFANPPRYRELTESERAALSGYAASRGHRWRSKLLDDWALGRTSGDLHRLRNELGPRWLASATLPNGARVALANRNSIHLLADLDERGREDLALSFVQYGADNPDIVHLWGSYEDSQFDREALVQKLAAVYEHLYGNVMYVLTGRRALRPFWVRVARRAVDDQIEQARVEGHAMPNPPVDYRDPSYPPYDYGHGSRSRAREAPRGDYWDHHAGHGFAGPDAQPRHGRRHP